MNLEVIQAAFQRAWKNIDKKNSLLVFFSMCLCGVLVVFSRIVSMNTGGWSALSLTFAPIFIVGGLLFALGVLVTKAYRNQQEGVGVSFLQIASSSMKTLVSISYITLPMLLLCLLSWLILGVFFLLKEIPGIGEFVGVFLSFAPFVLILTSLFLVFLNVVMLFFVTPQLSQDRDIDTNFWKNIWNKVSKNPLISIMGFVIASMPLFFGLVFLMAAAVLTQKSYLTAIDPLLVGLKWFFLMLPFNALLTPAIIFFFNFSFEIDHILEESLTLEKA
ncbi:MAG: hypothetical protein S4CHLAM6_09410 [Chlamydiae bacterium]|nr:hypothetical protein [Chlamydiota bacterium]